jgi:hypothetical protein
MRSLAIWSVAVAAAACLLVAADFHSRDPDSALYAALAADLSGTPIARWIAPEWRGHWNSHGPFREHPVGILLLPATAIRLGLPAEQAPYIVNMLYQVGAILMIPLVAGIVVAGYEARALAWALQLLPVAFTYRIRANQEHPVLLAFVAMVYATHRARTQPAWLVLTATAFCFCVLVKGAFAMFALVATALWLLIIPPPPGGSDRWAWLGLAATLLAAALLAVGYESLYVHTTGESFLGFYRNQRLGASISLFDPRVITHAIANIGFYSIRLLWFAAPWSLVAAGAIGKSIRSKVSGAGSPQLGDMSERALVWALSITAVYVAVLSPALVRAERFVFPAYFIIGAVGVVATIRSLDSCSRFVRRTDRYLWLPAAVWIVTFLLSLGSRVGRT